jgi:transposase-like protein
MALPESREVPVECPACGKKAVALIDPSAGRSSVASWTCPYCQKAHTTEVGGRLLWVVRQDQRADDPPSGAT